MNRKTPVVMVVEDESILLQTIADKLKTEGFETVSCTTTDQCLDYVENLKELPDAIWLDYYLEGSHNALTLLSQLQKKPDWKNIPTVIVSNSASKDKVDAMLAMGAKKYILKAEHRLSDIVNIFREFIDDQHTDTQS